VNDDDEARARAGLRALIAYSRLLAGLVRSATAELDLRANFSAARRARVALAALEAEILAVVRELRAHRPPSPLPRVTLMTTADHLADLMLNPAVDEGEAVALLHDLQNAPMDSAVTLLALHGPTGYRTVRPQAARRMG
jgi:hypothetical protein